jgi:hypothetical protein
LGAAASAAQRVKTLSCNNRTVYQEGFVSGSHAEWVYCLSLGRSTGPLYHEMLLVMAYELVIVLM